MRALDALWGDGTEEEWLARLETPELHFELDTAGYKDGGVRINFRAYATDASGRMVGGLAARAWRDHIHFNNIRKTDPLADGIYRHFIRATGLEFFRLRGVERFTANATESSRATLMAGGFSPVVPGSMELEVDLTRRNNKMDKVVEGA